MTAPTDNGHWLPSVAAMRHDLAEFLPETSRRDKFTTWLNYYWRPTRGWTAAVAMWWAYNVRRYPKPPPFVLDRVAQHLGLVDGVPACTDGPRCTAHGLMTHGD